MIILSECERKDGISPFQKSFASLNVPAALKVTTVLYRLEKRKFLNVKGIGQGVSETKIDFGPGYRIYFGKDGDQIVILLSGGTKKRQGADIEQALQDWKQYKSRKRKGN